MNKNYLLISLLFITAMTFFVACGDDPVIDPTCSDGILNNGEKEIDCGGLNCEPCGSISFKVDGQVTTITNSTIVSGYAGGSILQIQGGNTQTTTSFLIGYMYTQTTNTPYYLETGMYTAAGLTYSLMNKQSDSHITFTEWDLGKMRISGTFDFVATSPMDSTVKIQITEGQFNGLYYGL